MYVNSDYHLHCLFDQRCHLLQMSPEGLGVWLRLLPKNLSLASFQFGLSCKRARSDPRCRTSGITLLWPDNFLPSDYSRDTCSTVPRSNLVVGVMSPQLHEILHDIQSDHDQMFPRLRRVLLCHMILYCCTVWLYRMISVCRKIQHRCNVQSQRRVQRRRKVQLRREVQLRRKVQLRLCFEHRRGVHHRRNDSRLQTISFRDLNCDRH
uniref:(northern house mosquito) hypothetical protein n=2 Tax=Culex pipiens TaxID=7175 RepID=A0A8D8FXL4_CULPI